MNTPPPTPPEQWSARTHSPHPERDWQEDYADEDNGCYGHTCTKCGKEFQGHKRRVGWCKQCATPPPTPPTEPVKVPDWADDEQDRCRCERCGGEGFYEYNDGDGSDWGEDCPSEINHLITCRACGGTGEAK